MTNDPDDQREHRWRFWLPASLTAAVFAGPLSLDLAVSTRERVFDYLATDAFYYLTVARNFATQGQLSFDQHYSTNGYHPIWQLLLGGLSAGTKLVGIDEPTQLVLCLLLSMALILGAIYLLARCATRRDHTVWPGFVFLPIGVFAVLCAPWWRPEYDFRGAIRPMVGTLWSYVNGMESAVVLASYAAVAYLYCFEQPLSTRRRAGIFGALLALLTFARLDHGVFAVAVAGGLVIEAWWVKEDRRKLESAAVTVGTLIGLLVLYMILNRIAYGTAIPISGKLKSSFPGLTTANIDALGALLFNRPQAWLPIAQRQVLIGLPAVAACLYLPWMVTFHRPGDPTRQWRPVLRQDRSRFEVFLLLTAIGVICLAAYNLLYVHHVHQGHWYFPVSTLFVTLAAAAGLDRLAVFRKLTQSGRRAGYVGGVLGVVVILLFVAVQRRPGASRLLAWFYYEEAPRVRAYYESTAPGMVSYDDGIVAFATGLPTLSGYGFNLDTEAVLAKREGRLLDLAVERGFDRITGLQFVNCEPLRRDPSEEAILRVFRTKLSSREKRAYRYTVDYLASNARFCVVRVEPK